MSKQSAKKELPIKCVVPVIFMRFANSAWESGIGIGDGEGDLDVIVDVKGKPVKGPIYNFKATEAQGTYIQYPDLPEKIVKKAPPEFTTGWYGIPGGPSYRSTKTHVLQHGEPICGVKVSDDHEFQWCCHGIGSFLECGNCKRVLAKMKVKA